MLRILGIDPGTIATGYGLIQIEGFQLKHLDNGGIFPPKKAPLSERIYFLFEKVTEVIKQFEPQELAIEDIFVARNVSSTLKLGQARGAIIVAAKHAGLPVYEYSANQVKKAVTGYGHATKEQIQKMTQNLLKMPEVSFTDAADALAVAICHHNSRGLLEKIRKTP